jgi:hypothetical protein
MELYSTPQLFLATNMLRRSISVLLHFATFRGGPYDLPSPLMCIRKRVGLSSADLKNH